MSFEREVHEILLSMPVELVLRVVVTNAEGERVFSSRDTPTEASVTGFDALQTLLDEGDRMHIGVPVRSILDGPRVMAVSRRLLRDGQFEGAVHFTLHTDFLAAILAKLKLSSGDAVALVHSDDRFLVRSVNNDRAMGERVSAVQAFGIALT